MKKITLILAILIGILLILFIGKDIFAKIAIETAVRQATGLELSMQRLNIDVINTLIEVKGLELHNPSGYPGKAMFDVPEIYMDIEHEDLFKGKFHAPQMRLDVRELTVIKNEKGKLNLNSLKSVKAAKKAKPEEAKPAETKKTSRIQIDQLELRIGKVTFEDYTQGPTPFVKEYNLNFKENYENITDPRQLVSLIVVKALVKTEISKLTHFDVGPLKLDVLEQLEGAESFTVKAQEAVRQTWQATQETAKDLTEKIKQAF